MKRFFIVPGIVLLLFFSEISIYGKDCRIGTLVVNLSEDYPKPIIHRYDASAKLVVGSTLRENKSQSFISIAETDINKYPEKDRERLLKLYPETEIGPFLAAKKSIYNDFETTSVSTQKISGLKFMKVLWSGKQKGSDIKMRGIYLVARDRDVIYELNYVDYDDYFDFCSEEAMKIFSTLSH